MDGEANEHLLCLKMIEKYVTSESRVEATESVEPSKGAAAHVPRRASGQAGHTHYPGTGHAARCVSGPGRGPNHLRQGHHRLAPPRSV